MITSTNQWSPLPLPGGFGTSTLRPFRVDAIRVLVASPNTRKVVVARVKPDRQSLFSVKLPPGDYALVSLDRATEGWEMVDGHRHLELVSE